MSHWSINYLRKKWKSGADGPDYYDCWNFFRKVQEDIFNRLVPKVDVNRLNAKAVKEAFKNVTYQSSWKRVDSTITLKEGDAVLMSTNDDYSHIGVIIEVDNSRSVIHCLENVGVSVTRISELQFYGWRQFKFFKWIEE